MMEKSSVEIFDTNYADIKARIEKAAAKSGRRYEDITLLAATKTVDVSVINHAIESGIEYIGENRVQEFLRKEPCYLPVHKHFIGHLQTNKVKDIVGRVELIHSVDSLHLAEEISKQSVKRNVTTDILIEVNIGGEESKHGFEPGEVLSAAEQIGKLTGIRLRGLMAIPPICEEENGNVKFFEGLNKLFIDIKSKRIDNSNINILSMGMSDDFEKAIECGATVVRIGTALFGRRNYGSKA
ncbi:MAG: YggS family pyridoxal phosphate-dependent enzyme [Clostridia bacterium]|nr:YggS family pyridoxal phosphate-dependent enzyme [Clostridia bacterium]